EAAALIEAAGGDPAAITGPLVTKVAFTGDPFSVGLLADLGRWIGEGCATLAAVLDPELFVIGGGVVEAGDLVLEPAREAFESHLSAKGHRPVVPIVAAAMGNDSGMVGAAALARAED